MVRAARLAAADLLAALERGDFYASTGVELTDVEVTEQALTVTIREDAWSKYRVLFIGEGGRILQEDVSNPAVYRFTGEENVRSGESRGVERLGGVGPTGHPPRAVPALTPRPEGDQPP